MAGDQAPPVGSMFSLGWLMAQIFGPIRNQPARNASAHLPAIFELDAADAMDMAFVELDKLLALLSGPSDAAVKTAWGSAAHDGFAAEVEAVHLKILEQLIDDRPQLSAYQLGRALSDACWLPSQSDDGEFFLREFDRQRLATLQTWLAEASAVLPPQSAATVSQSLQNWQDWADVNAAVIKGGWTTRHISASVAEALSAQGSAWRALLSGQNDIGSQISLDAWVRAGQSVARTVSLTARSILRRFWPVVSIVAAATGGVLYVAIADSAGTAKAWTSLVTVAAALGVSGAGLRAAALKAANGIEQDLWHTANLDARAWGVTWLPAVPQGLLQRARLAGRGVGAPRLKTGLEVPASQRAALMAPRMPAAPQTPSAPPTPSAPQTPAAPPTPSAPQTPAAPPTPSAPLTATAPLTAEALPTAAAPPTAAAAPTAEAPPAPEPAPQ